jgi:hypothetical protein
MTCTLPALACNKEELHQVQCAVLSALLKQMGIRSKYPTALCHGPTQHTGLKIIDLKTESVFSDKEHGKMMTTLIKSSHFKSGITAIHCQSPTIPGITAHHHV